MSAGAPTDAALPGVLAEVARLTSPEVAVAIARRFGGQRRYIHPDPPADHPLSRLVGLAAARVIGRHLGRETVEWPSAKAYLHWWDARRLRAEGLSHADIAARLDLSQRRVRALLAGMPRGEAAPRPPHPSCPVCGHRHRPRQAHRPADDRQMLLFPAGDPGRPST